MVVHIFEREKETPKEPEREIIAQTRFCIYVYIHLRTHIKIHLST